MPDYSHLMDFAVTDRQRNIVRDLVGGTSHRKIASALGVHHKSVSKAIAAMRKRAAAHGIAPEADMTHAIPDPYVGRGYSTLYDGDGNLRLQWVKTKLDDERWELAKMAALEAACEDIPRLAALPFAAGCRNEGLLNLYTLTDCHVGMLAWHREGGANWDLDIAERTLIAAFRQMIATSPAAHTAFINQLGDFLHTDGLLPMTPTSGHLLDADGRFQKMVRIAVRVLRAIIDAALRTHDKVVVLLAEGNHDIASSTWFQVMFQALYENEPRVEIIQSALPYYSYQHGKTMLAFHHGHLRKPKEFPGVFAAQFPVMWGATTHRYAHAGHKHHLNVLEDNGMVVTQHPTLAARDAYAARGAWFAERAATCITYHSTYGQVCSTTVHSEMLED